MKNTSLSPRLAYSPQELAKTLGVSKSLIYQALERGEIPSVKLGRRYIIPLAAIEKMLAGGGAE